MLNLLRYLSNELQISLVCLGVAEARQAVGGDVQLARRLDELLLPRWQGNEEFQELVVASNAHCPSRRPAARTSTGPTRLAREREWFGQIMPLARRGAAQVKTFVRTPHGASVSPVAVLRLLSMEAVWKRASNRPAGECVVLVRGC